MKPIIFPSKAGIPSLKVEVNGKEILIYSRKDPLKFVKYEIENWKNIGVLHIILGLGLGYHTMEFYNHNGGKGVYLIIEPFKEIYALAEKYNVIRDLEKTGNIKVITGQSWNMLKYEFIRVLEQNGWFAFLGSSDVNVVKAYEQLVDDIEKKIKELFESAVLHIKGLGNSPADSIQGIIQQAMLKEYIASGFKFEKFHNIFKNKPAVIVSAGPSLNKNVHLLEKVKDRWIIIALDATYEKLLSMGIEPDFIVTKERDLATYKAFFEGKDLDLDIPLIAQSLSYPEIIRSYKGPKAFMFKSDVRWDAYLAKEIARIAKVSMFLGISAASVANMAYTLAFTLGCNPIILIGQDLAYSKEGLTHADGVSLAKKIDLEKERNIIWVDGVDGEKVPTNLTWYQFLKSFEYQINLTKFEGVKTYDCTEGGALIHGTEVRTFKEVIEEISESIPNKKKIIRENIEYHDEKKKQFIVEAIDKLMLKAVSNFKKAAEILEKLEIEDLAKNGAEMILKLEKINETLRKIVNIGPEIPYVSSQVIASLSIKVSQYLADFYMEEVRSKEKLETMRKQIAEGIGELKALYNYTAEVIKQAVEVGTRFHNKVSDLVEKLESLDENTEINIYIELSDEFKKLMLNYHAIKTLEKALRLKEEYLKSDLDSLYEIVKRLGELYMQGDLDKTSDLNKAVYLLIDAYRLKEDKELRDKLENYLKGIYRMYQVFYEANDPKLKQMGENAIKILSKMLKKEE